MGCRWVFQRIPPSTKNITPRQQRHDEKKVSRLKSYRKPVDRGEASTDEAAAKKPKEEWAKLQTN